MKGILGRKAGMTTVFSEEGKAIPVTVVEIKPNVVLQVKTLAKDGYKALKLGLEDKKINKSIKSMIGEAKKANTSPKYFIHEIRDMDGFERGDLINGDIFVDGSLVDVTGISKGKGFQGTIKRHNQSRGPMSHGSKSHRVTGSSGDIRSTVKKSKKMPGHMGHQQVTMQNLEIISFDRKLNVFLIKGSIPGPNKSFIVIKEAIKKGTKINNLIKLVDVEEVRIKNQLFEEGKKVGAKLTSSMSIEQMKVEIEQATIKHQKDLEEHKILLEKAELLKINKAKALKMSNQELKSEIAKVEALMNARKNRNQNKESEEQK
ncbi:MAG: hypothetical protein HPPSJP_3710 [Candidatus Hepatoplasma scabrum]|nr:MAG: hypothetical protein HPPSJP_3710 [Candidatus Hepatoplasma sp.]